MSQMPLDEPTYQRMQTFRAVIEGNSLTQERRLDEEGFREEDWIVRRQGTPGGYSVDAELDFVADSPVYNRVRITIEAWGEPEA